MECSGGETGRGSLSKGRGKEKEGVRGYRAPVSHNATAAGGLSLAGEGPECATGRGRAKPAAVGAPLEGAAGCGESPLPLHRAAQAQVRPEAREDVILPHRRMPQAAAAAERVEEKSRAMFSSGLGLLPNPPPPPAGRSQRRQMGGGGNWSCCCCLPCGVKPRYRSLSCGKSAHAHPKPTEGVV